MQGEHHRAPRRVIALHNLYGIVGQESIPLGRVEEVFGLKGHAEGIVEESFIELGVDMPGGVDQLHVAVPCVGQQLRINIEPHIEGEPDGILPLQEEAGGVHLHRTTIYGERKPLLGDPRIDSRLPYPQLKLRSGKSREIVAAVEVGGLYKNGLHVGAERLGDVVNAILEAGVGELREVLPPLSHIFHGLNLGGAQIGVAGLVCEAVHVAHCGVELAIARAESLAGVAERHSHRADLRGHFNRGKKIVEPPTLGIATLSLLEIVEFHMLVAQANPHVETAKPPAELREQRHIAFVDPVVGIGNFGDVGRGYIGGAGIGVFLSYLDLPMPERITQHKFLGHHAIAVNGGDSHKTVKSLKGSLVVAGHLPLLKPIVIGIEIDAQFANGTIVIEIGRVEGAGRRAAIHVGGNLLDNAPLLPDLGRRLARN